jgi:hypothetical protein
MRVNGGRSRSRGSEFEEVALKALAKDAERRFASMRDFTAALEQASFADGSSALTQPSLGSEQPPSPITRTSSSGDSLPTMPSRMLCKAAAMATTAIYSTSCCKSPSGSYAELFAL